MVGAGATLFFCYSVGNVLGPILATETMKVWQAPAFFLFLAAVHLLIVLYALAVMLGGAAVAPAQRRQPATAVTSLAGPLATAIALEAARDARGMGEARSAPP
jgi:hypothetical protein